jgi:hypothetical protein
MKTWTKYLLVGIGIVLLLCIGATLLTAFTGPRVYRDWRNAIAPQSAALEPADRMPVPVAQQSCCPTPTIAPSTNPTPIVVAKAPRARICLEPGEVKNIPDGYTISGDIDVWDGKEWKRLYDDYYATALLVVTTQEVKVRAPWGACAYDRNDISLEGMIAANIARGFPEKNNVVLRWPK